MALSENYRTETIGRSDCRPIVRLSADTIVRWDYRPNPINDITFRGHPRSSVTTWFDRYEFGIVDHCNYVSILHRLRDTATYWPKNRANSHLSCIWGPAWVTPSDSYTYIHTWHVTDRQTDRQTNNHKMTRFCWWNVFDVMSTISRGVGYACMGLV